MLEINYPLKNIRFLQIKASQFKSRNSISLEKINLSSGLQVYSFKAVFLRRLFLTFSLQFKSCIIGAIHFLHGHPFFLFRLRLLLIFVLTVLFFNSQCSLCAHTISLILFHPQSAFVPPKILCNIFFRFPVASGFSYSLFTFDYVGFKLFCITLFQPVAINIFISKYHLVFSLYNRLPKFIYLSSEFCYLLPLHPQVYIH